LAKTKQKASRCSFINAAFPLLGAGSLNRKLFKTGIAVKNAWGKIN
ncbi:hypothetical protein N335_12633, partial [Phaethon lepturus]